MSAAMKTAVVQHALDVAQIFKDNATLGRHLPERMPRLYAGQEAASDAQPVSAVAPSAPANGSSWKTPLAIGAAALLGASGIGAGLAGGSAVMNWLNRPSNASTVIQQTADESLLQSLQDRGFHLPPEKRGAK